MKTRTSALIAFLLLSATILSAGGFSTLPASARAVSFGGSLVSTTDGSNVMFYNPAGIATLQGFTVSTSFIQLFTGIQDDKLRYLTASASGNLGLVGNLGVGLKAFRADSWNENEITGSYAQNLFDVIMIGGSVKFLQWSVPAPQGLRAVPEDALSSSTLSFDAGLQAKWADFIEGNDIIAGVAVGDINTPSIAKNGSNDAKLSRRLTVGVTYLSHTFDYLITIHTTTQGPIQRVGGGAEFIAMKTEVFANPAQFVIRAGGGIGIGSARQGDVGGGFGLQWNGIRVDYAYQYQTEIQNLSGSHYISLQYEL